MNLRSILAIARKDALDIILNKTTLFALLSPIFIALLYALFSNVFGEHSTKMLIYNPGNSRVEQAVTSYFSKVDITRAASAEDVTNAFGTDGSHKDSSYALGLIVPASFESQIAQGQKPKLGLYLNGDQGVVSYDRTALTSIITSYVTAVKDPQPLNLTLATINPPQAKESVQSVLEPMFAVMGLLLSFMTGISLVPTLMVEEKEKKTLRMLMVSPASFSDIVAAKLLVGLGYQLLLSFVVALTLKGFTGDIPLTIVFILLGSCLALTIGLIAGSIFQSGNGVGAFSGVVSMLFLFPGFFSGNFFGNMLHGSLILQVVKILPTYYLGEGLFQSTTDQGWSPTVLLDIGVIVGATLVLFIVSAWLLHRQASVAAAI
ncbi:ABC transporter permease [Ktedonospora formicarum]|uniref:ABC transporter permease n=1 Tax=Ktedonospora formicarum TaxID=2778364 RepID=A0A8J3HX92_9CHLR|nr:ABC transporter permease [Ktedonospora formicarum]GHO43681.1 ABC transporter permease [Ktedonospora formicarum]